MIKAWVFLLLLPFQLMAGEVFEKLPKLASLSTSEKIEFWTDQFTGLPYGKGGPLGEGKEGKFDRDPLYRFDTFDCTTFVETVTALSLSLDQNDFFEHLKELRYKGGVVSYETRNHITSHSWIPQNTSNGRYTDVTTTFPEVFQALANANIDLPSWYQKHSLNQLRVDGLSQRKKRKLLKELQGLSSKYVAVNVELPYLRIDDILANWEIFKNSLSEKYVINIVRPDWDIKSKIGTDLLVSHQGFLFLKNGEPTMIHASTSGSVVQISLKKYLGWFKNSSSVKGINLLQINH